MIFSTPLSNEFTLPIFDMLMGEFEKLSEVMSKVTFCIAMSDNVVQIVRKMGKWYQSFMDGLT